MQQSSATVERLSKHGLRVVELLAHAGILRALAGEQEGGTCAAAVDDFYSAFFLKQSRAQVFDRGGNDSGTPFELGATGIGGEAEIGEINIRSGKSIAIPNYQMIMLPLLEYLGGQKITLKD